MHDCIVIGAGPAGISSSLYLKRSNKKILIIYNGFSKLEKAHKIDNYYGFENGISGHDLLEKGIKQAKNLNIEITKEEVIDIKIKENNTYLIKTKDNTYESKTLIISTGSKKITPNIEGIKELEGKGISYCAICDAFFYKNKNVVVIGNEAFAISEADDLKNIVKEITILTDGLEMKENTNYKVDKRKIKKVIGQNQVEKIEFIDGSTIDIDGIFIATGSPGAMNFAKKIGIVTKDNNIVVDNKMQTNIKGLYACGDVIGGLKQISSAVYEGAVAALSCIDYLNEEK